MDFSCFCIDPFINMVPCSSPCVQQKLINLALINSESWIIQACLSSASIRVISEHQTRKFGRFSDPWLLIRAILIIQSTTNV